MFPLPSRTEGHDVAARAHHRVRPPVAGNQNSAGVGGPLLLQDQHLLEKLDDDVIEKNLAHFHAADPEYGRRMEEAVRALRED